MSHSADKSETGLSFSVLLEYAADNDVDGFKRLVCNESQITEVALWYGHQRASKKRVLEHRTPLMIAAKYGSLDVLKLILALPEIHVNFSCGPDKTTALHCAVSGGSVNAIAVVKMLLLSGADPNISDANGHLPGDLLVKNPNSPRSKTALEELLKNKGSVSAKKEYPVDPSLPDIKNTVYATDEFRMFGFKIQPCSRAYSHDWTECPFVHPGENARRRDPRRFQYSCVPCPDHRKGSCGRGDSCEYSHGIFECWLHPSQYRTRLCKDGAGCSRRVCFFAHTADQLRPMFSFSSSPRSAGLDFNEALNVSFSSYFPFSPPVVQDYELRQLQLLKELSFSSRLLCPIKTGVSSPEVFQYHRMHGSFDSSSPRINGLDQFGNISSRENGSNFIYNLGVNQWPKKQYAFENADCYVEADEMGQRHKLCSNDKHFGEEPDVSWVQSVFNENPNTST